MTGIQTFDIFHSRLILRAKLVAETGLHIGAGGSLEPVGSDNPVLRDIYGKPYIPGSSFKGILRSLVERLIRAINPDRREGIWSCDIIQKECVNDKDRKELKECIKDDEEFTIGLVKQSCSVCRLFGSPWLASKVFIKDLYCIDSSWLGFIEVRDGVGIDRDTETAADKRKYDYEIVPRNTEFDLEMVVENADDVEVGLLFVGLREIEKGYASLGGMGSRGLGKVRLCWKEMELIGGDGVSLIEYLKTGHGKKLYPEERVYEKEEEKEAAKTEKDPLENAFILLAKAILMLEEQGLEPSLSRLPKLLKEEFNFEPHQVGLPKYGKHFIPAAVEAGWVTREGDIVRLTEGKRKLLLEEKSSGNNQSQEDTARQDKAIEGFIQEKIDKLIDELRKGGSHAQEAA
jgi:CRISPR-associated RAMP protein (TIGR02581 family)